MARSFDLYFSLNSLRFETTPDAKEFLKARLTEENALTPEGVYDDGGIERVRVVDNTPYEAEVRVAVDEHDGFLHNARNEDERVETYRQGMLDEHSPFIDWVKPVTKDV